MPALTSSSRVISRVWIRKNQPNRSSFSPRRLCRTSAKTNARRTFRLVTESRHLIPFSRLETTKSMIRRLPRRGHRRHGVVVSHRVWLAPQPSSHHHRERPHRISQQIERTSFVPPFFTPITLS